MLRKTWTWKELHTSISILCQPWYEITELHEPFHSTYLWMEPGEPKILEDITENVGKIMWENYLLRFLVIIIEIVGLEFQIFNFSTSTLKNNCNIDILYWQLFFSLSPLLFTWILIDLLGQPMLLIK